jgi:hypothetical protein
MDVVEVTRLLVAAMMARAVRAAITTVVARRMNL